MGPSGVVQPGDSGVTLALSGATCERDGEPMSDRDRVIADAGAGRMTTVATARGIGIAPVTLDRRMSGRGGSTWR